MENKIKDLIDNKKNIHDRVDERLIVELQRQKDAGKEFISDEAVDELIDKIIQEELNPEDSK